MEEKEHPTFCHDGIIQCRIPWYTMIYPEEESMAELLVTQRHMIVELRKMEQLFGHGGESRPNVSPLEQWQRGLVYGAMAASLGWWACGLIVYFLF